MEEEARKKAQEEREQAIESLRKGLKTKTIRVGKTAEGQMGFVGWGPELRKSWCDACAFDKLRGSPELEMAKMQATTVSKDQIRVGH
jgi:hypothetical protein